MAITEFKGDNRWLSNFWHCWVQFEGGHYWSVECAYVAAKTLDPAIRSNIQDLRNSGAAKKMGRKISLRKGWDDIKLSVMDGLLRQKFEKGTELGLRLVSTWREDLIEGNTWGDTFWGVCLGQGENNLGKLLMTIREDIS